MPARLTFAAAFPSPADLVRLPVEQIALPALRLLHSCGAKGFHLDALASADHPDLREYARGSTEEVVLVLAEAWSWLLGRGFLAAQPGLGLNQGYFVTRRGKAWLSAALPETWLAGNLLPERQLDPELAAEILPRFVAGALDSAVRDAFRRVEVRLRSASGLGDGLDPKDLVHAAFRVSPQPGPMVKGRTRRRSEIEGERDLLVGAMQRFRNPGTHNDIGLDDPAEAVELILLANLLLRIVARAAAEAKQA